jgi:hypothetical protein
VKNFKLLFLLLSIFILASCSSNDFSEESVTKTIKPEDLSKQKPLTQKDLDIITQLLPESVYFTASLVDGTITNKELALSTFKKYEMDRYRFEFVKHKVLNGVIVDSIGINVNLDPKNLPPNLLLTKEDLELIGLNKDKLQAALKTCVANKIKSLF